MGQIMSGSAVRAALEELVACDDIRRHLRHDITVDLYTEFRERSAAAWAAARAALEGPAVRQDAKDQPEGPT
jgi:hypothetical protein